jgi:hypothetical protein
MSRRRRAAKIENIPPVARLVGEHQKTDVSRSIVDGRIQTSDLKPIGHDHKKLRSRNRKSMSGDAFLDETDAMERVHRISTNRCLARINYQ